VRIDQFLPSFVPNDAIGNHVLRSRYALRQAGFESDIWAEVTVAPLDAESRPYFDYTAGADLLLYHASTHSRMADFLLTRPEPLLMYYHNITPARFFARWEPVAAASMKEARSELFRLGPTTQLAMAPSHYSETELVSAGYRKTTLSPLLVDFDRYRRSASSKLLARLQRQKDRGGKRWLFVGRLAPNKCQHDVIGAFAAFRNIFDPKAHLTLVGGITSYLYYRSLQQLVAELDLRHSVEFVDGLPLDELIAHYRTSDVFVCLSEHEGFGVPIIEAMQSGVPVVAYGAAAVPETVGDAGVVLSDKDPMMVASAVDRVLSDEPLRQSLVELGRTRAEDFSLPKTSRRLVETISHWVEEAEVRRA
jgi:glycosyltransferase involved in cell wall biosynthesis